MYKYFVVFTTHLTDQYGNEICRGCRSGIAKLNWDGNISPDTLKDLIEGRIQMTLDKVTSNEVLCEIEYTHLLNETQEE